MLKFDSSLDSTSESETRDSTLETALRANISAVMKGLRESESSVVAYYLSKRLACI